MSPFEGSFSGNFLGHLQQYFSKVFSVEFENEIRYISYLKFMKANFIQTPFYINR